MTDLSPEATVAAEAAAAAVEELHEREAVEENANEAAILAGTAAEASIDAANVASIAAGEASQATSTAEEAAGMAGAAIGAASEAQTTAEASIDFAAQAYEEARIARQELGEFRQELLAVLRPTTEETTDSGIEEVEVNDNSGTPEADGGTTEETADQSEPGNGDERRYGRRVRRNRSR